MKFNFFRLVKEQNLKILFVVPHYSFNIIGAVRPLLKDLAKELSKRGHNADVLSLYVDRFWYPEWKKETFYDEGIKITRWPSFNPIPRVRGEKSNILNFINCGAVPAPGFRKLEKGYDLINFFDMIDLSFPFFSLFLKVPKVHCCITLTEQFNFYRQRPFWRYVLSKTSDYYLASAEHSLGLLRELGIPEHKSDYLHHGVNTEIFKPADENRKGDTLLFLSRIEPRKGLTTLIEAMSLVKTKLTLLIAGQAGDAEYFSKVMDLVEKENSRGCHKIEYVGVPDDKEKVRLFQSASVFVLPSIYEDYGIVNLEALSCATPVIATRVGGVPEIVKDGENGFLVKPGDSEELASAIDRLMGNSELRRKMGEEGRKIVLNDFSWGKIIERLEEIYISVLNNYKNSVK